MEFTFSASSVKNIKELITILAPYAPVWYEWTESGACILSKQEIRVLQNYLRTGSHLTSSREFDIPTLSASVMLSRIKLRLCCNTSKFENWLTERLLEEHGIIRYASEQDKFLHSPLIFLPMPSDLKQQLRYLSEPTMWDVLAKHTESKLRNHWSLNDEIINNLKEVLQQNKCLHLLR